MKLKRAAHIFFHADVALLPRERLGEMDTRPKRGHAFPAIRRSTNGSRALRGEAPDSLVGVHQVFSCALATAYPHHIDHTDPSPHYADHPLFAEDYQPIHEPMLQWETPLWRPAY